MIQIAKKIHISNRYQATRYLNKYASVKLTKGFGSMNRMAERIQIVDELVRGYDSSESFFLLDNIHSGDEDDLTGFFK